MLRLESVLGAALDGHGAKGQEVELVFSPEQRSRMPISQLRERAEAVATWLEERGVAPGDRVALALPTGEALVVLLFGVWLRGAVTVTLPHHWPTGSSALERMLRVAEASLLITEGALCERLRLMLAGSGVRVEAWPAVDGLPRAKASSRPRVSGESAAHVQFSSGSTGSPRGVLLSHGNLVSSIEALSRRAHITPNDRFVSWLPIFHDLGLVAGLLLPLLNGISVTLMPTEAFVRDPWSWLTVATECGATLTATPNSALELLARWAEAQRRPGVDLRRMRSIWVGAEPVLASTLARFESALAPYGLRPGCLHPGYGLAEATLVVAGSDPVRPHVTRTVSRSRLRLGQAQEPTSPEDAVTLVSSGFALEGFSLRIVDDQGVDLPDGQEGQILAAGPSIAEQWLGGEVHAPARGGWLATGDMGIRLDGEIFVTGRIKDLIKRAGANYHPHDIEAAVGKVGGVRPGRVIAFSAVDPAAGELIVVAVETRSDERSEGLAQKIRAAVRDSVGVQVDRVVFLPGGQIPMTTSGKLQRALCKKRCLEGDVTWM